MIIEQARPDNYKEMYEISRKTLGENYIKPIDFYAYPLVYTAKVEGEIVGFITARLAIPSDFSEFTELKKYNAKDVMYVSTVAVKSEFQNKGTGSALIENIVSKSTQKIAFFTAWETKNGVVNIEHAARKLGFERKETIKRYWALKSVGKKNYCIDCGTPCSCNAVLFTKQKENQ